MPFVNINLLEGSSPEKIAELISEVTDTIARVLDRPKERVRILVTEVPKTHWGIGGETAQALGR